MMEYIYSMEGVKDENSAIIPTLTFKGRASIEPKLIIQLASSDGTVTRATFSKLDLKLILERL